MLLPIQRVVGMPEQGGGLRLICFRVGHDLYGVDIMRAREVIPFKKDVLISVATSQGGLVTVRGAIMPLYNLREQFGYVSLPEEGDGCLVIVRVRGQDRALLVDRPDRVRSMNPDDATRVPDELLGLPLLALVVVDGQVLRLVDIDGLVT